MSVGIFQPVLVLSVLQRILLSLTNESNYRKNVPILRNIATQSPSKFEFPNETSFDNLLESVNNELAMPLLTCNNHVLRKRVVASKLPML